MSNNNNSQQKKDATLNDVIIALDRNQNTLDSILRWIKLSNIRGAKDVLESILETDTKKIIYMLSDGNATSAEIAKKTNSVSQKSVSNYWQEWLRSGIGEPIPVMGGGKRFKRSFDLEDFGIKVPEISQQEIQQVVSNTEHLKTEGEPNAV